MSEALAPAVDGQGIEWKARFVQWGRGKWHVQPVGSSETACGRELPDRVRVSLHGCVCCLRCQARSELYEAAEQYRQDLHRYGADLRDERIAAQRAGRFTVFRCRLCGVQHQAPRRGLGTPFCLSAHHEAELEEVEAIGPAWVEHA